MEAPAPLSSNERALAISVLVMGGLVVLFSITTLAGAAYVLVTGKVMGGDVSRSITKLGRRDARVEEMMDRQLEAQAAVQKKWAPAQFGSEGAYVAAVVGAMVCAGLLLARGRARQALGQLALAAAAVRIAVGVVSFLLTHELMRGMTDGFMAGFNQGSGKPLPPEKAEELQHLFGGVMSGISIASAGCITFLMCGYFALVAYVFLKARPQPAAPAP